MKKSVKEYGIILSVNDASFSSGENNTRNGLKNKVGRMLSSLQAFIVTKKKVIIPVLLFAALFFVVLTPRSLKKDNIITSSEKWDKLTVDQRYTPSYILSPSKVSKYGISSKETFLLKTKDPQDENAVREGLMSSSPVKITRVDDNTFKINPVNNIGIGETLSFSIKTDKDYSWVFQTAPKFKITQTLPQNQAKNVPINAGVEITFNNDNYDLKSSDLEIQPKIDFRIEKHNEKAAIVPLTPLRPKTIYSVKVKKDFSLFSSNNSLSEDYGFSFQTSDENGDKGRLNLAKDFQEIFPDEHLITKVYADNFDSNETITAEVYMFPSADTFISSRSNLDKINSSWTRYYGEENIVDTKSLARVATIDLKLQQRDNLQYLELPQNLNEGMYLIQLWFDNRKRVEQLWVQSSSVAGYVSVGKIQTVVWLNSAKNESVGSSTVSVIGTGNTYSTNTEGWATFPTPRILFDDKLKHYLLVKSPLGKELLLPVDNLSNNKKPGDTVSDDYWSYIYHERVLYKPNDSVYFWGVTKDRDTGLPPSTVDIYLGDDLKQSVIPQADGSFIGKISLIDEEIGYKSLSLKVNDVTLGSSYLQVSDYVKPELKIEVEGNKKAIYRGESVDYKAKVTFFDGTPASNVNLYISTQGYGDTDKTQATANNKGEITFKYQSKSDNSNYYPRYEGVNISAIKSGDGPSDGSASVYVYGSELQIETASSQNKNQATLEATVNKLDLSLINDKGLSNPVSEVATNQKVSLITTKTWWEQKQTGTYYDFVEKITRPSYTHTRHDEVVEKKDLYTDVNGKIVYNLNLELNNSYQTELSVTDNRGNVAENVGYFYYSQYQDNSNESPKAYLNLDRDKNEFGIGEEVDLRIQKSGKDYQKTTNNKFLFILASRGKQDVLFRENPELKFNFGQKNVPEVYVGSIIFNGRYYEEVTTNCKSGWSCGGYDFYNNDYFFDPLLIKYRKEDSELEVSMITDKTKYQPGEKAIVIVKVTKNGNPVENASVQLTAVDEALAAIGGTKEPNILPSLYKQTSNLIYYNYYSHKPALPDGPQAERGGGGGGSRDLFKDTAFFDINKTDSSGIATFSINLPDNITSWLTYAQALTDDIEAGQAKSSIVATKDFFITSQFPNTVTVKDSPLVAISAFGSALDEKSQVLTKVTFGSNDQEVGKSSSVITAFKENYVEFPKLDIGNYKVDVRGTYRNYEDGIALPMKVIGSRLDFKTTTNKILQKGEVLKGFDNIHPEIEKPIKLLVTDEGKGKYYYNLLNYCYQQSNRIEKRIASRQANKILVSRFNDTTCSGFSSDFVSFQSSDGGLKQVEWGGSDLETTLWAVYTDPKPFDKQKLIEYFEKHDSYSIENKIFQNWGLTLLGVPKINELNQLAQSATTYREKVIVALALYSAGNTQRSKEIYMEILSEYGYVNKPYIRIQADPTKTDYDTYALDTSYALLLGTTNNIGDYSQGFNIYLEDYSGGVSTVILDIADINYINKIIANLPEKDTTVSFTTSSRNLTKNITKDGFLNLKLKSSEVNNFDLHIVDGKADAVLSYYLTPEEFIKLQTDKRISLTRTVTKAKGSADSSIKIGDILKVDLKYDFDSKAPLGCYMVTDQVPSGMTYLESPINYDLTIGQRGTLYLEKANIVKGCVNNSKWWKDYTDNISTYFVRVTGAGKFVQEPATIQSLIDNSIFQRTSEEYVTVSK